VGEGCVHAQLAKSLLLVGPESLIPFQSNLPHAFFPSEIRHFHIPPPSFFKTYFSIVLLPPQRLSSSLLTSRFLTKTLERLSSFQRLLYVPSCSVSLISLQLKLGVYFVI